MSSRNCPICGSSRTIVKEPHKYRYRESGLGNVYLFGGVEEVSCSDCGKKLVAVSNEGQLLQVIAVALLAKPSPLTGSEQKFLRKACGLTQEELAKKACMPRRPTIAERESKENEALDPPNDFFMRGVFLASFAKSLKERSRLSKHHFELLNKLAESFIERLEDVERNKRKGNNVSLESRSAGVGEREWDLCEASG